MTIRMDAAEVITAIEVASWVGSILAMLVIGLIVYLMVRPSRRRRERRAQEMDAREAAEMLRIMERMEQRLGVLERMVARDARDRERILEAGEGPEARRTK
jgi:flagellar biosynthesis/type III secretory pathway M-ring protein FliF/YscJ